MAEKERLTVAQRIKDWWHWLNEPDQCDAVLTIKGKSYRCFKWLGHGGPHATTTGKVKFWQ